MIDLHTHTAYSDGTDTPAELVRPASEAKITTLGITDHDTIAGWDEAAAAARRAGIALVRGMELTTRFAGKSVHILAYLFDPQAADLRVHRETMAQARTRRVAEMVERLASDFPITFDEVQALSQTLGRPHIADVLIKNGVVESRQEAFARFLNSKSPYYVPSYAPPTLDAISWINAARGKAVLAHPLAVSRGSALEEREIAQLAGAGLFGIEVAHRDNPRELWPQLSAMARSFGLLQFGSSDYHGSGKPNRLGENTCAAETLTALDGSFLEVLHP